VRKDPEKIARKGAKANVVGRGVGIGTGVEHFSSLLHFPDHFHVKLIRDRPILIGTVTFIVESAVAITITVTVAIIANYMKMLRRSQVVEEICPAAKLRVIKMGTQHCSTPTRPAQ
jgi:hypothetical protein